MKLLVISASQRSNSESAKVARYMVEHSQSFESASHIELCQYQLHFWDGEDSSKSSSSTDWPLVSQALSQSDALVLITPEWGGMASPLLKNMLLMCSPEETGHKPALLVSISDGINGAYPIAEIRMNALKNNKIVCIPDHLIIRNVSRVLDLKKQNAVLSSRDQSIRERIEYSFYMLHQYAEALTHLRFQYRVHPHPLQQLCAYGM